LAKKPDHLANFEADDTGGVLSNLLAEEEEFDRRALWRIGSWGVGATAAVILDVMANQSSLGLKRDQVAAADLTRQAQQIQQVREYFNQHTHQVSVPEDRFRLYVSPPLGIPTRNYVIVDLSSKCECGAEKCKSNIHSDWCPKHV